MDCERKIKSARDVFGSSRADTGNSQSDHSTLEHSSSSRPLNSSTAVERCVGSDSAISGSSDDEERQVCQAFDYLDQEEECLTVIPQRSSRQDQPTRDSGTEELRHIERRLSMKKTLRKKMMRDLRQAVVSDPNEFCGDHSNLTPEQRGAIDLRQLRLAPERTATGSNDGAEPLSPATGTGFLTMLRHEPDSGRSSPTHETNTAVATISDGGAGGGGGDGGGGSNGVDAADNGVVRSQNCGHTQSSSTDSAAVVHTGQQPGEKISLWKRLFRRFSNNNK